MLHLLVIPDFAERNGHTSKVVYTHNWSCDVDVHMQMSKSRGNVVNPDEVVMEFGADSLRLYEMFMGPLRETKVRQICHHYSCLVLHPELVTTKLACQGSSASTRSEIISNPMSLSLCAGMEHKGGGGGAPVPGAVMASHNRRCDGLRAVKGTAAPAAYDHQTGIWPPIN